MYCRQANDSKTQNMKNVQKENISFLTLRLETRAFLKKNISTNQHMF